MNTRNQTIGNEEMRWPEGAIVYHIYPRSLQDSNADGIGDLPGVTSRLDYINDLGVNAIWLSPFYPSPMADFGYDVADYCDVDPIFGTLEDFDEMLARSHSLGIKVIIDLVPNHTSDDHKWFKESSASRDNPRADWYVWRDQHPNSTPEHRMPPNNWRDVLTGGPAWEWCEARRQFYLHSFDVRQPDLNWANPEVREAMKKVMRFWLDRGVDGFRVDAVYWMGKEPLLSDDSPNPEYVEGESLRYDAVLHDNSRGWPVVYAYLSEMADVLKEPPYYDSQRFMVTEAYPERHNPLAAYMNFYVAMDPTVAAPFNFEGVSLPWQAAEWRRFLKSFHAALSQFNPHSVASYAFGNHDQPRLASRLGTRAARSSAVMLLTLPGMAFIYYGEEIGMENAEIPPEYVQDPAAKGDPRSGIGRDPERTPMQWTDDENAGFTEAKKPWLPLPPDYTTRNVANQERDPASSLFLYRRLGELRNKSPALKYGSIEILDIAEPNVLGYVRRSPDEDTEYLTLVNFSSKPAEITVNEQLSRLLVSSDPEASAVPGKTGVVSLLPYEAVLFAAVPSS